MDSRLYKEVNDEGADGQGGDILVSLHHQSAPHRIQRGLRRLRLIVSAIDNPVSVSPVPLYVRLSAHHHAGVRGHIQPSAPHNGC